MASASIKIKITPELDQTEMSNVSDKIKGIANQDSKVKINVDTAGIDNAKEKSNGFFANIKEKASELKDSLKEKLDFSQIANFSIAGLATDAISSSLGAIKSAFGTVIEKGSEFQQSMAGLSAITGVSGAGLDSLGESAKNLAEKFGTGASEQLAAFQGILSKIGPDLAKSPEDLNKVTDAINTLGKAGGLDAKASMDALIGSMLQFNVDVSNSAEVSAKASQFMNVMAASAKVGAAEIPQVAEAIKQAGVAASGANLSFEETNAAIQVLATGGKVGSEAGIALRNSINLLQKQSGEGEKVLAKMGLTTLQLGHSMQSGGLSGALKDLKGGFDKLTDPVEKNQALIQLFGAENSSAVGILLKGIPTLDTFTKQITGTNDATEQAAINMNTFGESLKRSTAYFENIAIGVFQKISPVLGAVTNGIFGTVKALIERISAVFGVIGQIITPSILEIKSVFDAVFGGIGDTIKEVFSGVDEAFAPLTKAWNDAFGPLTESESILKPFTDVLKGVIKVVLEVAGAIGNVLVNTLGGVITVVAGVIKFFGGFAGIMNTLTPLVQGLAIGFGAYQLAVNASAIGTAIMTAVSTAQAFVTGTLTLEMSGLGIAMGIASIATGVMTVAQSALNIAMSLNPIGLIIAGVALLVAGIVYAYNHFENFRKVIDGAWTKIKELGSTLLGYALYLNPFTAGFKLAYDNIKPFRDFIDSLVGKLKGVGEAISNVANSVKSLFSSGDKKEIKIVTTYTNDTKELEKVQPFLKGLSKEALDIKKKELSDILQVQKQANKLSESEYKDLTKKLDDMFASASKSQAGSTADKLKVFQQNLTAEKTASAEQTKEEIASQKKKLQTQLTELKGANLLSQAEYKKYYDEIDKLGKKQKEAKDKTDSSETAIEGIEKELQATDKLNKSKEKAFETDLRTAAANAGRKDLNFDEQKKLADLKELNAKDLFAKAKELLEVTTNSDNSISFGVEFDKKDSKEKVETFYQNLQNQANESELKVKNLNIELNEKSKKTLEEVEKFRDGTLIVQVSLERSQSDTLIKDFESQKAEISKNEVLNNVEKATQILEIEKKIQAEITKNKLEEIDKRQSKEIEKAKAEVEKITKDNAGAENTAKINQIKADLEKTIAEAKAKAQGVKDLLVKNYAGSAGALPQGLQDQLDEIDNQVNEQIQTQTAVANQEIQRLGLSTIDGAKLIEDRLRVIKEKGVADKLIVEKASAEELAKFKAKISDEEIKSEKEKYEDWQNILKSFNDAIFSEDSAQQKKASEDKLKAIGKEKDELLKSYASQLIDRRTFYEKLNELDKQRHEAEKVNSKTIAKLAQDGIGGALKSMVSVAKLSSKSFEDAFKGMADGTKNFSDIIGATMVQLSGNFANSLENEKNTGKAFLKATLETAQAAINIFMAAYLAKKLAMTVIDWVAIAEYGAGFILVQAALATAKASFEKGGVFGENRQGGELKGGERTVLVTYNEKGSEFFVNSETTNKGNNIKHLEAINSSHLTFEEYAVKNQTIRNLVKDSLTNSELSDTTVSKYTFKIFSSKVNEVSKKVRELQNTLSEVVTNTIKNGSKNTVETNTIKSTMDNITELSKMVNVTKELSTETVDNQRRIDYLNRSFVVSPFNSDTQKYIYYNQLVQAQSNKSNGYDMERLESKVGELIDLVAKKKSNVGVHNTVQVDLIHDTNQLLKETQRLHSFDIQRG